MSNPRAAGKANVFLATTALEEFWDTARPIVFLGEWCRLYSRRAFWEPLGGRLMQTPFASGEVAHAAVRYVNGVYERVLLELGDVLNEIHDTRHGLRYWRILLGPWLQRYLAVTYDKYLHLQRALEQFPDFTTIVLSENSFVIPSDTLAFVRFLKEDSFSLQAYTKILTALGRRFPGKEVKVTSPYVSDTSRAAAWPQRVLGAVGIACIRAAARRDRSILLRSSHFPRSFQFRFLIMTAGRVLPLVRAPAVQAAFHEGTRPRRAPRRIELGHDEFERCLSAMLFSDIPLCFVEDYARFNEEAQAYPRSPKAIFSSIGWYFEESFKQWAAACAEKGTQLMGTPHGGNYGGPVVVPSEDHETTILDLYYSWGWERTGCAAKVIPLPAGRLAGRKKLGASNRKTGVLWVTTSLPRYLIEFPTLVTHFPEYVAWQARFARTLLPKILPAVRLRPHVEDDGWDIARRIVDRVPAVSVESADVPFLKSLADCRLYVGDHLSTTFTEALSMNKPTILFWSPRAVALRPEAQPYFDLLRKAGIFFDTPESAGAAVNRIYDEVEAWWNAPERQDAVEKFCERFARNSPDAVELWIAEFKGLGNAAA